MRCRAEGTLGEKKFRLGKAVGTVPTEKKVAGKSPNKKLARAHLGKQSKRLGPIEMAYSGLW